MFVKATVRPREPSTKGTSHEGRHNRYTIREWIKISARRRDYRETLRWFLPEINNKIHIYILVVEKYTGRCAGGGGYTMERG